MFTSLNQFVIYRECPLHLFWCSGMAIYSGGLADSQKQTTEPADLRCCCQGCSKHVHTFLGLLFLGATPVMTFRACRSVGSLPTISPFLQTNLALHKSLGEGLLAGNPK